jgi:hypothetical protein
MFRSGCKGRHQVDKVPEKSCIQSILCMKEELYTGCCVFERKVIIYRGCIYERKVVIYRVLYLSKYVVIDRVFYL